MSRFNVFWERDGLMKFWSCNMCSTFKDKEQFYIRTAFKSDEWHNAMFSKNIANNEK